MGQEGVAAAVRSGPGPARAPLAPCPCPRAAYRRSRSAEAGPSRGPPRRPCRGPRGQAAGVPDDARGGLRWCKSVAALSVRAPATRRPSPGSGGAGSPGGTARCRGWPAMICGPIYWCSIALCSISGLCRQRVCVIGVRNRRVYPVPDTILGYGQFRKEGRLMRCTLERHAAQVLSKCSRSGHPRSF
jgi:hypothetical protein